MTQLKAYIKITIRKIKEEFRKSDLKHRIIMLLQMAAGIFGIYLLLGSGLGLIFWITLPSNLKATHTFIYYGCFNIIGFMISGTFTFLLLRFVYRIGTPSDLRNEIANQDERGVNFMEKGVNGTARRMTKEEAYSEFVVGTMEDSYYTVWGSFDKAATEVVHTRPSRYGGELRNTLLCGPSGTQKSRCFNRNEVINSTLRGESGCYTDPSLELYTEFNDWCRKKGAEVYNVNFKDPERSDGWNCLQETLNESTGRIDPSRLSTFASVFINNCDAGKKEDAYWHTQAVNYLKATIGYVAWRHEDAVVKFLKQLYLHVAAGLPECADTAAVFKGLISISWCKNQILDAAVLTGYDSKMICDAMERIERYAPPFNMEEVVRCLKRFENVENAYLKDETDTGFIPEEQVGKDAYRTVTIKGQSENAKTSGIISTLGKLSLFTDPVLTYNLSRDGIRLSEINKRQTICFVGMPDTSTELEPITSLFFTFLFINTQKNYDKAQALSLERKEPNPILDMNIVLDDFFSIGVIGGDPNLFTTYMSNARKRHLYITMIIQDMSQLKTRYGVSNYNTILSNCAYQVCFGASDPVTMDYFSGMTGIATTLKVTERRTDGLLPRQKPELSVTTNERNLYTSDEIWNLPEDECIVIKAHKRPLHLYKVSYENHPVFKRGELDHKVSAETNIRSYYEKTAEEEKIRQHQETDRGLHDYILSLRPCNYVDENGEIHSREKPEKSAYSKKEKVTAQLSQADLLPERKRGKRKKQSIEIKAGLPPVNTVTESLLND